MNIKEKTLSINKIRGLFIIFALIFMFGSNNVYAAGGFDEIEEEVDEEGKNGYEEALLEEE